MFSLHDLDLFFFVPQPERGHLLLEDFLDGFRIDDLKFLFILELGRLSMGTHNKQQEETSKNFNIIK